MDLRNCIRCGKIFNYISSPICEECKEEDNKLFEKVKKFIDENPDSNISDIAKNLDISERKLLSYIKNGRLELKSNNVDIKLECEKCGKKIITGRFCNDCLYNMMEPINLKNKNILKKSSIKMHTYKKNK